MTNLNTTSKIEYIIVFLFFFGIEQFEMLKR